MTITPKRLAEIEARAKAATPGPWKGPVGKKTPYVVRVGGDAYGSVQVAECGDWKDGDLARFNLDRWLADAAHIARMDPSTTLALVAHVREVERERDEAKKLLPCGHHHSLSVMSAETGGFLFCELCDVRSARNDAEQMESVYKSQRDAAREALAKAVEALEIIVGVRQCIDNLMGNRDVAFAALTAIRARKEPTP